MLNLLAPELSLGIIFIEAYNFERPKTMFFLVETLS